MTPNTARTISCKAWKSPVEYPSRVCKHDIKESKGSMSNIQGECPGAESSRELRIIEPELLNYRKPKCVFRMKRMAMKSQ